tara:strand:- start:1099 stop:1677 length:579 start_codon:yes stop_codon:yes gene_type:complete
MASILNANNLAVYHIDTNSGDKPYVFTTNSTSDADIKTALLAASSPGGFYSIKNTSGLFTKAGVYDDTSGSESFTEGTLVLLAAATSSTLDISNEINDVARDAGQGGVIQEKDNSFTISTEGLIESITTDTGRTLVDIANAGDYVFVYFMLDIHDAYVGYALIDSISLTGTVDETATYSVTFAGVDSLIKKS